ncbi:MAG: 23S rRNA pseudouridine(1911/1915/1917) synthase RluD [Gammaproteobacteria bacterium]|jgi:23S rRNA pseudouridine1911/1915/1917 synthase|nr:23S rRNA pseudouridine(1911/1915/1917) synthase RluD [Gammaproteobacteria bacterium]MBT5603343.1 23S rRNA pseudouridine(1911/1915/1917) synthase RluD [Gammaproteobacteria bacterium]MBT6246072.1 23S rRNA pseudouridine(1911/1915/1917) synthase RluD [Gammaproteobacteria bacterium]
MSSQIKHRVKISESDSLKRLDMVAAQLFPQYSRSKLQQWIRGGVLTLNGNAARPKDKVPAGAVLEINVELEDLADGPEPIPLRIEFEDDDLLVVNKPAGLVVHPGAGNPNGTLLNALLYHAPECRELPRAGIIHRLDKDTSGLLVVAKRLPAMTSLVQQLQRRTVKREYEAIALGSPKFSGEVQLPIGRHPTRRTKMAIQPGGKEAVTHYWLLRQYGAYAHMKYALVTGRTHQIRVHMQHLGCPLVGDAVYGTRKIPRDRIYPESLQALSRQALHARRLAFSHPINKSDLNIAVPLPEDMQQILNDLAEMDDSSNA